MAIDPNIAMSFKPTTELNLQPTNILAQYGQLAAIQNAQNQNALAQFQLGAAQRAEAKDIARTNALAQAGTDDVAIGNALLRAGDLKGYADFLKTRRETQKADVELIDAKLKQSRAFLENVSTPEQYIAWHEANHLDPILGPALKARGITPDQSRARIMSELEKPGGFQNLLNQSKLGTEKFIELNKPHYITENLGGTSQVTALPGLGGAPATVSSTKRTATPGELMQDARARERLAAESESGNYSPETIQYLATQYNLTGQLPTLGIGKKASAVKMQILEEARKIGTAAPTDGSAAPTPQQAAENVVQNKQTRAVEQSTLRAFSAGPEGRSVRSFNTAVDHLDTMSKLATALENNDIRVFNTVANAFAKGVGVAAPTNFDTAKSIVGGEVAKALAGSSMALKDREEIRDTISRANSPAQLAGSVRTLQELMGGQLKSLKQQYQTGTNRKDFDAKLSPRARQVVSELEGQQPAATGPVKISGDADYDKLPSGAIFIGPDGQQRRKP